MMKLKWFEFIDYDEIIVWDTHREMEWVRERERDWSYYTEEEKLNEGEKEVLAENEKYEAFYSAIATEIFPSEQSLNFFMLWKL